MNKGNNHFVFFQLLSGRERRRPQVRGNSDQLGLERW